MSGSQLSEEFQALRRNPQWVEITHEIFEFQLDPQLTIGTDHNDPSVLALTDGGGDLYVTGDLATLLAALPA